MNAIGATSSAASGRGLTIDAGGAAGYWCSLLIESETSGGLLFSVAPIGPVASSRHSVGGGEDCWEIGAVLPEPVIRINA